MVSAPAMLLATHNDQPRVFAPVPNAQRKDADDALRLGHLFILSVLELQKERFKLDALQDQIQGVIADYNEIWLEQASRSTKTLDPKESFSGQYSG